MVLVKFDRFTFVYQSPETSWSIESGYSSTTSSYSLSQRALGTQYHLNLSTQVLLLQFVAVTNKGAYNSLDLLVLDEYPQTHLIITCVERYKDMHLKISFCENCSENQETCTI